jgi:5-methyltetrahydrofolate--homocysteine methyltransferase
MKGKIHMHTLFRKLLTEKPLVCDGAMGTMLQANGLLAGHCPEELNVSKPDILASIHKAYFDAGADLVETNTFGGNWFRLNAYGFGQKVDEYNRVAAEIACSVRPEGKLVAGSLGPTGEFIKPMGILTQEQLAETFEQQIEALCRGGIDVLFVETMMDINEAMAGLLAAKKVDKDLPVVVSMTFDQIYHDFRTMMGQKPQDMIDSLISAGADVIGSNCGKGMDEMTNLMILLRDKTNHPLLAQANAGLPIVEGEKVVYPESPEQRGNSVKKLLDIDINIIGGCCGTTPEHIKAIRKVVDEYVKK